MVMGPNKRSLTFKFCCSTGLKKWSKNKFESKTWSSHLLDNRSDCLICALEKFQVPSTGFKSMTSVMPVQCSYQLSYDHQVMDSNPIEDTSNFSGAHMRQSLRLPTSVKIISSFINSTSAFYSCLDQGATLCVKMYKSTFRLITIITSHDSPLYSYGHLHCSTNSAFPKPASRSLAMSTETSMILFERK